MQLVRNLILGIIVLFTSQLAIGQGATCGTAQAWGVVGTTCVNVGYSFNSGAAIAAPSCSAQNDDGFYSFTPTTYFVRIAATSNKSLTLVVYSGGCGGLVEVGCGAVGAGGEIVVGVTPGTAYILRLVRSNGGGGSTNGNVCMAGYNAPGKIGANLVLWLDANSTTGTSIASWTDLSSFGNTAVQATASDQPRRLASNINFNQAVDFDGTDFIGATAGASSINYYSVASTTTAISNTSAAQFFISHDCSGCGTSGGGIAVGASTATFTNEVIVHAVGHSSEWRSAEVGAGTYPANTPQIYSCRENVGGTDVDIYVNGLQVNNTSANPYLTTSNQGYNIGRSSPASPAYGFLVGQIGEIVDYNVRNSDIDHQKVESYLAIKYGITLGNTTSTYDYLASDGTVVWTGDATYQNDVAGVGRDDDGYQNQVMSKSENIGSIVTGVAETALGDLDFLVWGNNAAEFQNNGSTDIDGVIIEGRVDKVWHVDVTNTPGTMTIIMDLNTVPGPITGTDLRLLVDADGTFASGATALSGSYNSITKIFTVTGVSFTDEDFFTLGTINFTQTPLPVEMLSFDAKLNAQNEVELDWVTATEYQNSFFTIQRSRDGNEFEDIGTVQGAGTASSANFYHSLDPMPYSGVSYYRIKQTDFNQTSTYSEKRSVELYGDYTIYPNPANGHLIIEGLDPEMENLNIVFYNAIGQLIRPVYSFAGGRITIDSQQLADGVYFLEFNMNEHMVREKIIVAH